MGFYSNLLTYNIKGEEEKFLLQNKSIKGEKCNFPDAIGLAEKDLRAFSQLGPYIADSAGSELRYAIFAWSVQEKEK